VADTIRSHLALTSPIVSERLVLRSVQTDDDAMLTRLWTDPLVRRYMDGALAPGIVKRRNADSVGKPGKYSVVLRTSGEPIGLLGIGLDKRSGQLEVSYGILPEYWRHGYGREALEALLTWVFEQLPEVDLVVANTRVDNEPSRRLLEAIGAEPVEYYGRCNDLVVYAIARPR
jgi:ribosomal-protein-alanine N-acetyltransferase